MGWRQRFRDRLVLGRVPEALDFDEMIVTWVHARLPDVRAPGILVVTNRCILLHIASLTVEDRLLVWDHVDSWDLELHGRGQSKVRLTVHTPGQSPTVVEINVTTAKRARAATEVLAAIIARADTPQVPEAASTAEMRAAAIIPPPRRGLSGHVRRVLVTIAGVLVLILSAIFASPFVPGPGALTAVAGIAILAREYEWAQDLHVWANRLAERFIGWMRDRAAAVRARRAARRAARRVPASPVTDDVDRDRVVDAA